MNTPDKQVDEEKGQSKKNSGDVPGDTDTEIGLEERFPETQKLLDACIVQPASDNSVMVAFDTNALLLPYNLSKDDLGALSDVFKTLASESRLFLPARYLREFINLRDRKLADLIEGMNKNKSKLNAAEAVLSPLFNNMEEYKELEKAAAEMNSARKTYLAAYGKIVDRIRQWRGNDPVTSIYRDVFQASRIVEPCVQPEDIKAKWQKRLLNKIPLGYKDRGKIGDFVIWMSLLRLGCDNKKDLIFVTGEEKSDWFVRAGAEPIYTRPELIDEYRRSSGGRNIRLSSLYDLLRQMKVSDSIVEEVQRVEQEANTAIRDASGISQDATQMGWSVPWEQLMRPPRQMTVFDSPSPGYVPMPPPDEKKD